MLLLIALLATAAPLAVTADDTCPEGFSDLDLGDDRCYYFSSNESKASTWTLAFVDCQTKTTDGAEPNLLSIADPLHFYPMAVITQQSGKDAFIGLLNNIGVLSWADGTPYNSELDQFISDSDPSSSDIYGYISADDQLIHFTNRSTELAYICDVGTSEAASTTPAPPACPEGWLNYTDGCYLFSEDEQVRTTAEHTCFSQGADLVSIHDSDLLTYLLIRAGSDVYWTGLENEEDQFQWADGTSTDDIDILTPFLDGWTEGKNCVVLKQESYPTSLVHENCFVAHKYVCYQEAMKVYDYDAKIL